MSWEARGDRRYYYRKRRIGDKVTSEYWGASKVAGMLAEMDEDDRASDRMFAEIERAERTQEIKMERAIQRAERSVREVVELVLQQSGFRQHKGQWRQRRT